MKINGFANVDLFAEACIKAGDKVEFSRWKRCSDSKTIPSHLLYCTASSIFSEPNNAGTARLTPELELMRSYDPQNKRLETWHLFDSERSCRIASGIRTDWIELLSTLGYIKEESA